jgi:hypothetical protein
VNGWTKSGGSSGFSNGVAFTESIASSLIEFLLDRVAVVTSHHSGSEKWQAESSAISAGEAKVDQKVRPIGRCGAFFIGPDKTGGLWW